MNDDTKNNEAMHEIAKNGLTKSLLISTVLHIVVIALFSISFISLCIKYKTLDPKAAIAVEKEQAAQKELEAKREKQSKEAAAPENQKTETPKKSTDTESKSPEEKKIPQVIKDTEEVIKERPTAPSSLNKFDDNL